MIPDAITQLVNSPVDYHTLQSPAEFAAIQDDPRYWRVVAYGENMVQMLRVPLQVKNDVLLQMEQDFAIRVASRTEMSNAFRTSETHQYQYPWGDNASAARAPYLMRSNPNGMGMNMAGLYFNGPDNPNDPRKNGLWMVTAERNEHGHYIRGDRSGTAGNVGVFEAEDDAGQRGILPGHRAVIPGDRGVLPGNRGALPGDRGKLAQSSADNFLTPAGIGEETELYPNEGYLIVKDMTEKQKKTYNTAKQALGNKVSADHGISLMGVSEQMIVFGVAGHCMLCPNPLTLTMPINGPEIARQTGLHVIEYPEFVNHQVIGRRPIMPDGVEPKPKRIYTPA